MCEMTRLAGKLHQLTKNKPPMAGLDKSQLINSVGKIHHGADALDTELTIPMTIDKGLETGKQFELRITEDAARELYVVLKERLGL
jgi:hypothetical protein